ncbi:MAG: hypothetical protein V4792_10020 [Pseudomonadota bacterium]
MASTGAVLFFRPRSAVLTVAHGVTGAVSFVALRTSSGIYSSRGVNASRNLRNLKSVLPDISVPISLDGRMINPEWYRAFRYVWDTFLNVINGPTLPDVVETITLGQVQSIVSSSIAAALEQQAAANAQSIASMREVVQAAALPGATQIPPAQLNVNFGGGGGGDSSSAL